jgi:homocysteine S-methyltransferase
VEEAVRAVLGAPGLFAVGVNCTPPAAVAGLLRRIAGVTDLPLVAYPNAGGDWDGSAWHGQVADPTALVDDWVAAGARLVGGCCGVGPDGVARIKATVARRGG